MAFFFFLIFYAEFQEWQILCTNSTPTLAQLILWLREANSILARLAGSSFLKVAVETVLKDPFSINSSPSRPVQSLNFLPFMSHSFHVKASQNQSCFTSPGIN